jgi:hypothetical protein
MADPTPDPPQLYQIIGSVLRDVAQARYMSDRYSRQISYQYEKDSLLRTFPVPRVEVDEVEFDLHFGITSVSVDPKRKTSENAAIAAVFDGYSISITRAGMAPIRQAVARHVAETGDKAESAAANQLDKTFLSDENREKLRGRLLRFFNESVGRWFDEKGVFQEATAKQDIEDRLVKFRESLAKDKDLAAAQTTIKLGDSWKAAIDTAHEDVGKQVDKMLADIKAVMGRYPDYKVEVDVTPAGLQTHPAVSHVRVKSSVKNYRWSKIDVDPGDLRNVRSLTLE